MIDFVKTTSYDEKRIEAYFEKRESGNKKIKWKFPQTKHNLEHYLPPYELRSAPEELREQSRKTEDKVDKFQRTISTVLAIIIGVIAVLVAAAGIFVTQLPITESKIRAVLKEVLEERSVPLSPKTSQGSETTHGKSKAPSGPCGVVTLAQFA